ncbi:MAG: hypothetical protein ACLQAT_19755 [Candidatus Binataceae bacterium]
MDGRLAAFEDGASWPDLLTRYDATDENSVFLRLERRSRPRSYAISPLLRTTTQLGEGLKIDHRENFLIWARVGLKKTALGTVLAMLTKTPIVNLDVTLSDGTSRSFRILPAAATEGFLLSPVVESRLEFLALDRPELRSYLAKKQVREVRIVPQPYAREAYRDEVPVELYRLELKGNPPPIGNKLGDKVRRLKNLMIMDGGEKSGICAISLQGDDPHMLAIAPSRIIIDPPPAKKMTVGFGIADGAWQGGNHTDGVEFRIPAVRPVAAERTIWSRRLAPFLVDADRGKQEASVDLQLRAGERLVFETLPIPGGTTDWAWSYWSGLDFD